MHKNFSNQLERDTALDSLQIWEQCSPGSFTETSRDAPVSSHKDEAGGDAQRKGRFGRLRKHGEQVTISAAPQISASPAPLCKAALKLS